jgi:anti-sigma factor (TIGR02949 family)
MNCSRARFLLYAYLDRELSSQESDLLSRHLAACPSCSARAESARGLARILRSRIDRPAPVWLRERLQKGVPVPPAVRPRYPLFVAAAGLMLLILPLSSGVRPRLSNPPTMAAASILPAGSLGVQARPVSYVAKSLSGTFVCIICETRTEAGLCRPAEARHEPAFCADNGEVWRLMSVRADFNQMAAGRTATVEGIAFPQSGYLRANRVGY